MLERGQRDLSECFSNGTFVVTQKGALVKDQAEPRYIMTVTDGASLPIAIHVDSALPHEVTLVDEQSEYLIGDKAYASDLLDATLAEEKGLRRSPRIGVIARN